MGLNCVSAGAGLIGSLVFAVLGSAPGLAQDLPNWRPDDICAADSAKGQCLLFERRAQNDVTTSWNVLPDVARTTCLSRFTPPLEPSWRILGDCIEIEGRLAQQARVAAQKKREAAALVALTSGAAQASKAATPAPTQSSGIDDAAEQKRIADEEASFLALLAEQRRADEEAAARKAEAKRAAEEARNKEAAAAAAAKAKEERERLAKDEAERQEAQRRAEEARRAALAAEAERKRVAQEEASFLALLEEQRRADEEAKKLADAAKKRAAAKAEAERLAAARRCEERIKTTMAKGAIEFQFNSAALSDQSGAAVLDALAEAVRNCEGRLSIIVEGHTDSTGSKAGNLKLSEQRAAAVAEYLRKKGVAGDNISSSGFGASKPIASNRTASGRAKNRRIEFRVK